MEFPYTPKHLIHNSGSKILEVLKLTHEQYPPSEGYSQDIWCAVCRVEWSDTKKISEASIQFGRLGYEGDEGRAEYGELSKAMSDYLMENGAWNHEHDDLPRGWTAHRLSKGLREKAYPEREAARKAIREARAA